MKNIVVFTGAGVSADSGISTFRDSDGLWDQYRIEDVCTPEALDRNRAMVVEFYNIRRKELLQVEPNVAHRAIVELEKGYNVKIVTQNIDDLHQRAGSLEVLHLHGELRKLRSSHDEQATVDIDGWEQKMEVCHADGSLLRPFVVFFGESVPMFDRAIEIVRKADIMIIIGTSLAVYPAASLVQYLACDVPIYLVDPVIPSAVGIQGRVVHIKANAAQGVPRLVEELLKCDGEQL